ncbi:MAG: sn-glycerol-3-phosphate dehydrogenase subunit C [Gammaproteobacteria bacterium RBG_16_66_13]|nr:MAG: sn-glycerol-3-phosphate dehydrogenase subunit C [Gammaproteobacteria bacterium RBG_16_66_13]
MTVTGWNSELCLKCNICTAACPVAAVTDQFLGPKAAGPQAERFRHPRATVPDPSVSWCSGCGVCSRVCPHGVPVAELNILAKARLASQHPHPFRDQLLARPSLLAAVARPLAPLANALLGLSAARALAEAALGVSRHAPMPRFASATFRSSVPQLHARTPQPRSGRPLVAYFHGCSVDSYEPWLGRLTLQVLEAIGFDVVLPPQGCCGLPLQSNGLLEGARNYARTNLDGLGPFAAANVPIIGTSTSCTLALKHEYRAILGLAGETADQVAEGTYDLFEFLLEGDPSPLTRAALQSLPLRVLYHPPCQLQGHGIGWPALEALRRIPDLDLVLSESDCCGVAGTYGLKRERYDVARGVGEGLFDQVQSSGVDAVVTDSETCRWWVAGHAGVRAIHPVEILATAMGLPGASALAPSSIRGHEGPRP